MAVAFMGFDLDAIQSLSEMVLVEGFKLGIATDWVCFQST